MTGVTKTDLDWWLELEPQLDWQFATTYAEGAPHEYVVLDRTEGISKADYVRAAHVIRTFGEPMKFYKSTRLYLPTPMGFKHWTMDLDLSETTLVNRCRAEHVYGPQNSPRTASGIHSQYDKFASTWDAAHGLTVEEQTATVSLIRETFGEKLWRTLDVGCGTGLPLDLGLAESVRYVGVDPSSAMLNCLVAKHPLLAGVHPMTFAQAIERRVLCGSTFETVLALGGAASYLAPNEIDEMIQRAKRSVLLMHYRDESDAVTTDVDAQLAAASLSHAISLAAQQVEIGRFVATVIETSSLR